MSTNVKRKLRFYIHLSPFTFIAVYWQKSYVVVVGQPINYKPNYAILFVEEFFLESSILNYSRSFGIWV